ncbi:MAG: cyclase family protein [Nocardiopsaceae bacterium]|nr:cyclase family protein [Nocardiopsaceae bacterium]
MPQATSLASMLGRARTVDLTLTLAEELPAAWSTHMPYQQKTFQYFTGVDSQASHLNKNPNGPYQTRWLLIDEHTGTHVDAPAHFIPEPDTGLPHADPAGTVTAEQIPLEQLAGPAVVIDVPKDLPGSAPGRSPTITKDLIADWESVNGPVEAGEIVLFRTGWDRHYLAGDSGRAYCYDALVTGRGPGWPAPDAEAMAHLIERGVTCVGTDGVSMGTVHDGAGVHHFGLARRVAFIEALGHLGALPVRGALFFFAPLKVARGTGAPGRAFALLPEAAPPEAATPPEATSS